MSGGARHSAATAAFLRGAGNAIAAGSRSERRLCVLNYHRVLAAPVPLLELEPDVTAFRWQMALLAQCFNVLPLTAALEALDAGALPPRAVCITFDDGYRSVHDLALPVLKEFGLPATVFVTSGYVDGDNMWNDRIIDAVRQMPPGELDLRAEGLERYAVRSLDERKRTVLLLTEASKYLAPARRTELVRHLERLAGSSTAGGLMLTPAMLANLVREGIDIGGHTVSHPILTRLDDEAARREIELGKEQLEALTGRPVRVFAYPNGKVGKDFDERHVRMAAHAGFTAAFTTVSGAITRHDDRFRLPRSRPWDATPLFFGLRLLRWLAGHDRAPRQVSAQPDAYEILE